VGWCSRHGTSAWSALIAVHDLGFYEGHGPVLVMQHVDGESLLDTPPADPLATMLQVADALDAVHAAGLLHRDVKPANILMRPDGRPVLIDFGLVLDPDLTPLTATGKLVGSLGFMAPELLTGSEPTPAADWYAWAVTLYYLLEGKLPYRGEDVMRVSSLGKLPRVRFSAVSDDGPVAGVLRELLDLDPDRRVTSAADLRRRLGPASPSGSAPTVTSEIPPPRPPAAPRRGAGWILAFALVAGTSAWFAGRTSAPAAAAPPPPAPARDVEAEELAETCRRWLERRGDPPFPYSAPEFRDHLQAVLERTNSGIDDAPEARFWGQVGRWLASRDDGARPLDPALYTDVLRVALGRRLDRDLATLTDAYGATLRGPVMLLSASEVVARDMGSLEVDLPLLARRVVEVEERRRGHLAALALSPSVPPALLRLLRTAASRDPSPEEHGGSPPLPPPLAWVPFLERSLRVRSLLSRVIVSPENCLASAEGLRWLRATPTPEGLSRDLRDLVDALRALLPVQQASQCDSQPEGFASVAQLAETLRGLPRRWRVTVCTHLLLYWTGDSLDRRGLYGPSWDGKAEIVEEVREEP
jgi:hypothetical protein